MFLQRSARVLIPLMLALTFALTLGGPGIASAHSTQGAITVSNTPSTTCVDTSAWGHAARNFVDNNGNPIGRVQEAYSLACGAWWARAFAYGKPNYISQIWIQEANGHILASDVGNPTTGQLDGTILLSLKDYPPEQYLIGAVEQVGNQRLRVTLQPVSCSALYPCR